MEGQCHQLQGQQGPRCQNIRNTWLMPASIPAPIPNITSPFWSPNSWHPRSMPMDSIPLIQSGSQLLQFLAWICLFWSLVVLPRSLHLAWACGNWNFPQTPHIHREWGLKLKSSFCLNVQFVLFLHSVQVHWRQFCLKVPKAR